MYWRQITWQTFPLVQLLVRMLPMNSIAHHTPFLHTSHVVDCPAWLVLALLSTVSWWTSHSCLVRSLLQHLFIVWMIGLQVAFRLPGVTTSGS